MEDSKTKNKANIEAAARKARYAVFEQLLEKSDCLLLAHHLNDQAETLLLQLARGAGINGLAAMVEVKQYARGVLARPLLQQSRQSLKDYAQLHQLKWIEDESNRNLTFSRNYLRHQVIPLLQKRWPAIISKLADTSKHCQQAQANLDDLARIDCPALDGPLAKELPLAGIKALKPARISNVLRVWLKMNQIRLPSAPTFNRLIHEVIEASSEANPQISWDDIIIRRYQETLYVVSNLKPILPTFYSWPSFPEPLDLGEERGCLLATPVVKGLVIPAQSKVEVRFRQGGELFRWHGQTKQLKKLFQEWQIPPWLRDHIPLLYVDDQFASVVGYAISDIFYQYDYNLSYEICLRVKRSDLSMAST